MKRSQPAAPQVATVARTALIAASLLLVPLAALAAEKGRPRGSHAATRPVVAKNDTSSDAKSDKAAPKPETAASGKASAGQPATARTTKPRVYDFGGLEVEGKLKTPQLLYFRTRVKQELDTSTPEKRSFMKELEKSADDKGL
jgi:hypothetical protein